MSDTDNEKPKLGMRAPLGLKRTVETGKVKQSFSHGRSNTVVVEVKRRRILGPRWRCVRGSRPEPTPAAGRGRCRRLAPPPPAAPLRRDRPPDRRRSARPSCCARPTSSACSSLEETRHVARMPGKASEGCRGREDAAARTRARAADANRRPLPSRDARGQEEPRAHGRRRLRRPRQRAEPPAAPAPEPAPAPQPIELDARSRRCPRRAASRRLRAPKFPNRRRPSRLRTQSRAVGSVGSGSSGRAMPTGQATPRNAPPSPSAAARSQGRRASRRQADA